MSEPKPDPTQHPVWTVYDELRTARLNVRCLERTTRVLKFADRGTEIVIAFATTSAVGSFWFLQTKSGELIWKTVGALAVLLSIVRPILKIGEQVRLNERLLAGYSALEHDLNCIRMEIQHRRVYDNPLHRDFIKAMERKADLVKTNTHSYIPMRLRKQCENLVLQELPGSSFFIPEA